jgi:tryptophan 2-C-methyltransferase
MRVALVNPNRIRPPIGPIGLEYVAEALAAGGHEVEVLDLCWAEDRDAAVESFFRGREFGLVGVSLRNTDDCSFFTRESFLDEHAGVVKAIRNRSGAPVLLGGVGFSVMPEAVLDRCGAEAGIRGDGEFTFPELARRMERGQDWDGLPNLVVLRDGRWRRNPVSFSSLSALPPLRRDLLDNPRYFREGGQAGFETKRGCPCHCVYCADPAAKGDVSRLRPPAAVADEIGRLLAQGIDHLHTCDSEFNIPGRHALEVCRELVRRGMGEMVRWYAYCSPVPFSPELARWMRKAGCAGINFGTDSGDEGLLARLGREFGPGDVLRAVRLCREQGIAVMLDLLFGSPGETRESVRRTIGMVREADPDRAGIAVGVRVYPGTRMASFAGTAEGRRGMVGGVDLSRPVFYLEPAVSPFLFGLLDELTRGDERFLFFDPERPEENYNYNANDLLVDAIAKGHRGAYWDILRRYRGAG